MAGDGAGVLTEHDAQGETQGEGAGRGLSKVDMSEIRRGFAISVQ